MRNYLAYGETQMLLKHNVWYAEGILHLKKTQLNLFRHFDPASA